MGGPRDFDLTGPNAHRTIPARFFHPTGVFREFPAEDLDRSIPELFMRRARDHPDRVAVKTTSRTLTYAELDRDSARIADAIVRRRGTSAEPAAIILGKGIALIAAVLGTLRAGRFAVVLEPTDPAARNAAVLEDVDPAVVLVDATSAGAAEASGVAPSRRLDIDEVAAGPVVEAPRLALGGDALASIVFTSGTTGRPKGAVLDHRALLHNVRELINVTHLTPEDHVSLVQPLTVIAGFRAVWVALLAGGTLCPFDVAREGLPRLNAWLREERISLYHAVPTLFRHMAETLGPADRFPDLRTLRLGGETVSRRDFEVFRTHFADHAALLVTYNASEVSTVAWFIADGTTRLDGDVVPVGFAREGTEVLLLDDGQRPVAPGEAGEIVVRTRYMARGYWGRPDLTVERFLPDPAGGDERLYRTGDRGCFLPDGCLVHLGRTDTQAKVRGFRVETAEVEAVFMEDPGIKQAVVVMRGDPGNGRLCAYVVPARPPGPSLEAIRRRVQGRLPAHMVPTSIVVLDTLPLTVSGKVARNQLPAPGRGRPALEGPFVASRSPIEERLADIWRGVLNLEAVGIHDRFLDLGGTSLDAGRIASRVQATLGAKITIAALLTAPTVADMALAVVEALTRAAPEALDRSLEDAGGTA